MIARSHLAFGGDKLVLVGCPNAWKFTGGAHTYTRKLIEENRLLRFDNHESFLVWSKKIKAKLAVVEIDPNGLSTIPTADNTLINLVLGNEQRGIPDELKSVSDYIYTIKHTNAVASINVAASAAIAMNEVSLDGRGEIKGAKMLQE